MKRRIVHKVEKLSVVEKLCELQRQVCEYERYMGDLLVMLCKEEPQCVLQHNGVLDGGWIWDKVRDLLKEVKTLRANKAE